MIITFGTTTTVGSNLLLNRIRYELTDMSENNVTSTATIPMVATSDNGTRIGCNNGQTELSRDVIVANMSGMFSCFFMLVSVNSSTLSYILLTNINAFTYDPNHRLRSTVV